MKQRRLYDLPGNSITEHCQKSSVLNAELFLCVYKEALENGSFLRKFIASTVYWMALHSYSARWGSVITDKNLERHT